MTTASRIAKQTAILTVAVIQIIFFPALGYAEATGDAPVSSPTSETSQPVSEDTSAQSSSETPPATEETTTAPETSTQNSAAATPESQPIQVPENSEPIVSDQTISTSAQDQDTTIDSSIHVTNNIPLTSQSGDAGVVGNRVGGNAATGNADGMVNLINLLQSQSNVLGQNNMFSFTADIQGNVVGDLLLDPGTLAVENSALGSANVRVTNAMGITNMVDLDVASGDATVAENRVGGDATTGNANAVVNIVNLLNSIVNAGGSFFGNINIYGDLDGDILLPENFLSSAIASNSIPTATVNVPTEYVLDTNLTNDQSISNVVNATASSGDATVKDNRVGGTATTGNGTTNITVLNLTGNQVIGANTLLVFVNVQGEWVGLLMDAPTGSTAAALGGGLTQNSVNLQAGVDVTNTQQINNLVNVNAESGDATVKDNRVGGNATAGNATASANIANMANTQFNLSNWFGILFINVFGKWHGSFGINTAAGNPILAPSSSNPVATDAGGNVPQAFAFVPGGVSGDVVHFEAAPATAGSSSGGEVANFSDTTTVSNPAGETLGAATPASATLNPLNNHVENSDSEQSSGAWVIPALGALIGISLLAGERFVTLAQRRRG